MKLQLTKDQHDEISEYVKQCSDEIGGLGTLIFDDEGTAHVEQLFMVKQKVHGSTCELDPEDINRVMFEVFEKDCKGQLCFWWHSHVNMGVSPSGQDDTTMAQIGNAGYSLAMIINKRGEMSCRYHQKHPRLTVKIDVEVKKEANSKLEAEVKANIEKYVSKLTYSNHPADFSGGGARGWEGYYNHMGPDDGYDYRRTLHPPTTKENTKVSQEKSKSSEAMASKTTTATGRSQVREFYAREFKAKCVADPQFANEQFKDYCINNGVNPTDLDQLEEWYIETQMFIKL